MLFHFQVAGMKSRVVSGSVCRQRVRGIIGRGLLMGSSEKVDGGDGENILIMTNE